MTALPVRRAIPGWATFAMVLVASTAEAASYWVDASHPDATDSGPGTESEPYRTVSAAVAARGVAGNEILIMPGTYPEMITFLNSGASSAPIVVRAPQGRVVLDGADDLSTTGMWKAIAGNVYLAASVSWAPRQVFVNDVRCAASLAPPTALPARTFSFIAGQGLYLNAGGGNPGSRTVKVGHRLYGVRISGKSWIQLEGLTVTRSEERGFYVTSGSNNVTLAGDTATYCQRYGFSVTASSDIAIGPGLAKFNREHGFYINGATRGAITEVESSRSGVTGGPEAAGVCLYGSREVTLARCRLHHNQSSGVLQVAGSASNPSLQNRSYANRLDGFEHRGAADATHIGDVAWNNQRRGVSGTATPGITLTNCIVGNGGIATSDYELWLDDSSRSGFASTDNLWWNAPSAPRFRFGASTFTTLATFVEATAQEVRSLQADPWFVDAADADFRLSWGSRAIDCGNAAVPGWPVRDAKNHRRTDDPSTPNTGTGVPSYADRGALEFRAVGSAPIPQLTLRADGDVLPVRVIADASASTDGESAIAQYRFEFSDGIVVGPQPSAVAERVLGHGLWTVSVRVQDANGNVSATSATLRIGRPPVAFLDVSPVAGKAPLAVTLDASRSSDPDGGALTYRFDFGDGSRSEPQASPSARHEYAEGVWTPSVTVTDDEGASGAAAETLTVRARNIEPVARLQWTAPFAPGFRALATDPSQVFDEPAIARPAYWVPATEPTFGTTVTRIAGDAGAPLPTSLGGGAWSLDVRHHYSKDQPWNADGTLVALDNEEETPQRLYVDGESYAPRFEHCQRNRHGDDRWHPSLAHRNERISVSDVELAWIDVVNCVKTRSWSLPFKVKGLGASEGNPSQDGRYVALFDSTRAFVVDMDPQPPFAPYPSVRMGPAFELASCGLEDGCIVDWVSISPSGKYVVAKYRGERLRVLDVDPATLTLSQRPMPWSSPRCAGSAHRGFIYGVGHADMALDPFDNNEDVLMGQEHCGNRGSAVGGQLMGGVVMVRLRDGRVTSLTDPTNEAYPHHVTARNVDRPGWVYVTYFPEPGKRFSDEIVAVKMDGSHQVQRFAHAHTDDTDCYRCEAHGVPSRDGRRVMWASNWSLQCDSCGAAADIKAMVADARAMATEGGASPVEPYTVLADATTSTDADGIIVSYRFDFGDGTQLGPQSSPHTSHTYAAGSWMLTAIAIDDDGATSTAQAAIVVAPGGAPVPVARLIVTPSAGRDPLHVVADASASVGPERPIRSYRFDFGDGEIDEGTSPIALHTYGAGTWTSMLTIADDAGAADTATAIVRVATAGDTLGPNLVANSSFESSTTGWAAYAGAIVTRVLGGVDGSWALQATGPASLAPFGITDSPNVIAVVPWSGVRYRISGWVRATDALGVVKFQVREYFGGVRQGTGAYSAGVRLAPEWQRVSIDFTPLFAGSTLDVQVLDTPAVAGESFEIDAIVIQELLAPRPAAAASRLEGPRHQVNARPRVVAGTLEFTTAHSGLLRVDVFDVAGRHRRRVVEREFAPAGGHRFELANDDRSSALPSGVYFYRIQSADGEVRGRFAIAR